MLSESLLFDASLYFIALPTPKISPAIHLFINSFHRYVVRTEPSVHAGCHPEAEEATMDKRLVFAFLKFKA